MPSIIPTKLGGYSLKVSRVFSKTIRGKGALQTGSTIAACAVVVTLGRSSDGGNIIVWPAYDGIQLQHMNYCIHAIISTSMILVILILHS